MDTDVLHSTLFVRDFFFLIAGGAKSDREAAASEKKREYGTCRAPEKLSFGGRVEGGAPHPSLKGQGEGREAYYVSFFRCAKMIRFSGYPLIYIIVAF